MKNQQEKFQNDAYRNYCRDCDYARAVRMFYALKTLGNHNANSDASKYCADYEFIADALEYALSESFTPLYADRCDVELHDVAQAREVGEKHAEMKRIKGLWNEEQGFKDNRAIFDDSTTAQLMKSKYGSQKFITNSRPTNDDRVPFVDREHR